MGEAYKQEMFLIKQEILEVVSEIAEEEENKNATLAQRARVILLAEKGITNKEVGNILHMHENTTRRWKVRFRDALPKLNCLNTSDREKLRDYVEMILCDKHKNTIVKKNNPDLKKLLRRIANARPEDYGLAAETWSLSLISMVLIYVYNTDYISLSTLSRILKREKIRIY